MGGRGLKSLVLDVGCGCLDVHTRRGDIGIDINPGLADVVCDARYMPIRDDIFGIAICDNVLEHMKNPEECLDEMRRVVKKRGRIQIVYPLHAMSIERKERVLINPLVVIDLLLGFKKLLGRRKKIGIPHVSEISFKMIERRFEIISVHEYKSKRHLHSFERIFGGTFTCGGWAVVELRCRNDK